MIFRTRDPRTTSTSSDLDVLLTAAEQAFGRYPDGIDDSAVTIGDHRFVFEPSRSPAFVRQPTCDRCGVRPAEQFPLAVGTVNGADVWVQTHATCRDCRFVLLASTPAELTQAAAPGAAMDLRVHERRLERRARRRARRDARSLI